MAKTCIFHAFVASWWLMVSIFNHPWLLGYVKTTYGGVKVVYQPLKLTAPLIFNQWFGRWSFLLGLGLFSVSFAVCFNDCTPGNLKIICWKRKLIYNTSPLCSMLNLGSASFFQFDLLWASHQLHGTSTLHMVEPEFEGNVSSTCALGAAKTL